METYFSEISSYESRYILRQEVNCMRTVSRNYGDELEIRKMYIDNSFTIIVEIFTVPEGYKSFARNSFLHHGELLGSGFHVNKEESVNLAINDLQVLMEENPEG